MADVQEIKGNEGLAASLLLPPVTGTLLGPEHQAQVPDLLKGV